MFNFFKRFGKNKERSSLRPNFETEVQPKEVAQKTVAAPSPRAGQPSHPGARDWKIGQTMKVTGLGEFLIHDIKGGEGKSGMGIVYIVLDMNSTPFAVKTLQRQYLDTEALVRQFLRECETWIKMEQHENIARAFYVCVLDGHPYVFLEYVSGSDLRKKISSGQLSIRNSLRYSIQFCRGMAHAGRIIPGFVHRDVKPENCLLTFNDVLKVTDFGLVKILTASKQSATRDLRNAKFPDDSQSRQFQMQEGDMGIGTMPYMAPEQFTNFTGVGITADVYSFGVMLYEMLTRERPFRAQGIDEWYAQHLKTVPCEPSFKNEQVSSRLSSLTMRCLAKNPKQRFPNFAVLEKELAAIFLEEFRESVPSMAPRELELWEILNKGAALGNLGRSEAALECFDKVLALSPGTDAAWTNKGVILAKLGRETEAVKCYKKSVEINPRSADAWYNLGKSYYNGAKLEEALASFERALEIDPLFYSAWLNKGVTLRKLNRPKEAVSCYDRALAINPQAALAWYNKGFALRQIGRTSDELQCYDRSLAIDPDNVDVWLNRGAALRKLNRLIEASVCYDHVLDAHPRHAPAWYNKGIVLRIMGQKDEARSAFQKAAVLDPKIATDLKRQGLYP